MTTPDQADVDLAVTLVTEAGTLAARMRSEGVQVEQKTSISDVVTAADRAAEAVITDRLAAQRPDDGVLGEEGAARPGRRTWVIDPVDGTYNFVSGLDWWCSAIALVDGPAESGELVLGAVYHHASQTVFVGGPGRRTTRNGVELPDLVDIPLAQACVTTYLPPAAYAGQAGVTLARAVAGAAALRMLGSGTMDLTAIAQGNLGVFCQRSVPAWDRLPGEALVRGVGGTAAQVEAGGSTWTVIGPRATVAEVRAGLRS
ncbi:MAG: inositol monophosphatase family protein [Nocardioides sp.]